VAGILQKVEEVQQSQVLLTVPFTTIFEYLQVCVTTRSPCGKKQMCMSDVARITEGDTASSSSCCSV
jgi:hypothetical protein